MYTNFPSIWKTPQNSRRQKGNMKQVIYGLATVIRHQLTTNSDPGDLVPWTCTAMLYV
jgi:hypothetical protein